MAVTAKATIYDGVRGAKIEMGTLTFDPASLLADTEAEATIAFDGATVGDQIFVNPTSLTGGLVCKGARVSTADVVALTIRNTSTGTVDGASVTYDYLIVKYQGDN
jgi:hypothetical protein